MNTKKDKCAYFWAFSDLRRWNVHISQAIANNHFKLINMTDSKSKQIILFHLMCVCVCLWIYICIDVLIIERNVGVSFDPLCSIFVYLGVYLLYFIISFDDKWLFKENRRRNWIGKSNYISLTLSAVYIGSIVIG